MFSSYLCDVFSVNQLILWLGDFCLYQVYLARPKRSTWSSSAWGTSICSCTSSRYTTRAWRSSSFHRLHLSFTWWDSRSLTAPPMTSLATSSNTSRSYSPSPWFSHAFSTLDGLHGNSSGVTLCGLRQWHLCPKLWCCTRCASSRTWLVTMSHALDSIASSTSWTGKCNWHSFFYSNLCMTQPEIWDQSPLKYLSCFPLLKREEIWSQWGVL